MQVLSVNYHYVRENTSKRGIHSININQFSNQLDVLSKYYKFISQNDLINMIIKKKYDKNNYCLLTFDDGLKEQMHVFDLLNKKGIPGTFYVNTGPIRDKILTTVHKIHHIRSIISDEKFFSLLNKSFDISKINFPKNINKLYRYDILQTKKLKYLLNFYLNEKTKNKIINKIFFKFFNEKKLSNELYMNIDDLKIINKKAYLGIHGDMHLPLAKLNRNNVIKEIKNSLNFLKSNCKINNIKSISYPYGGPHAVSEEVFKVCKKFDFIFGLTMFRGINKVKDLKLPLKLKRIDANDAPGGKFENKDYFLK